MRADFKTGSPESAGPVFQLHNPYLQNAHNGWTLQDHSFECLWIMRDLFGDVFGAALQTIPRASRFISQSC